MTTTAAIFNLSKAETKKRREAIAGFAETLEQFVGIRAAEGDDAYNLNDSTEVFGNEEAGGLDYAQQLIAATGAANSTRKEFLKLMGSLYDASRNLFGG